MAAAAGTAMSVVVPEEQHDYLGYQRRRLHLELAGLTLPRALDLPRATEEGGGDGDGAGVLGRGT